MKVLFTGFNGFNNSSKAIIDKINMDKLLFNNSYKEIDNQLADINMKDHKLIVRKYLHVVMLENGLPKKKEIK